MSGAPGGAGQISVAQVLSPLIDIVGFRPKVINK